MFVVLLVREKKQNEKEREGIGMEILARRFLFLGVQKILMRMVFGKGHPTLKSFLDFGLTPRLTTFAWI